MCEVPLPCTDSDVHLAVLLVAIMLSRLIAFIYGSIAAVALCVC